MPLPPNGRKLMAIVVVSLPICGIQDQMLNMRPWLDAEHIEPSLFKCEAAMRGPVARVGFSEPQHAEAFVAKFAGRLVESSTSAGQ
jgi:hypothetical protein